MAKTRYAINEQIAFDMTLERLRTYEAFIQRNITTPHHPALRKFLATGGQSILERRPRKCARRTAFGGRGV